MSTASEGIIDGISKQNVSVHFKIKYYSEIQFIGNG